MTINKEPLQRDWLDKNGKFIFGKHAGKSLETVILLDYSYVCYILENYDTISDEDREIMETQLHYRR